MPLNELVQSWLVKADHDLETAKIVASHLPDYDDVIAFHCQQSIEKSLKGYLVYLDLEFKPVHDLGYLLNLVATKDQNIDAYFEEVDEISRYAVQIRYPDALIKLQKSQIKHAIDMAGIIYQLVTEKVS